MIKVVCFDEVDKLKQRLFLELGGGIVVPSPPQRWMTRRLVRFKFILHKLKINDVCTV